MVIPGVPGVYIFKDDKGKVIYVGKAKNLKNRLSSYSGAKLEPKTARMVSTAKTLEFVRVDSEFEALLLEAKLVKKYQPKYNIELRDDKSPLYIGITAEELPRIILLRQKELDKHKLRHVYGPFVNSTAPRKVLSMIRRIFPYSTHKPYRRPCVYNQIGLCDPCPSVVGKIPELREKYLLNVRRVSEVLSGRSKTIVKQLEREMKSLAASEDFEAANELKRRLEMLAYTVSRRELDDGYVENPNLLEDIRRRELAELASVVGRFYKVKKLERLECFDIAHLAGSFPTASMVTFIDGEPEKSLYRRFKVSSERTNDDTGSMGRILARRKRRFKAWGKPDLIIVDGGKGQLAAALEEVGDEVLVVGLAKREEKLVFSTKEGFVEVETKGPAKRLVQRIRDEAHRFARSYHHKLVSRAIREI